MVQICRLKQDSIDLLQTLDEHVGVITGLLFTKDGTRLLSYSADRTIIIREDFSTGIKEMDEVTFLAIRTITLKSTPVSAVLDLDTEGTLFVSTTDRRVQGFHIQSGRLTMEFKIADSEGGDSVMLNSIQQFSIRGYPVIAGVSSSDKSVRLYDDTGRLLAREFGPTEGMTGLAVFHHEAKPDGKGLVTVAADGTIFSWNLSMKSTHLNGLQSPTTQPTFVARPPLRRILSASEVTRLQALRSDAGSNSPTSEPSKSRRMSPERRSPERQLSRLSLLSTPRLETSPILKSSTTDKSPSAETRSRRLTTTGRLSPVRQNSKNQTGTALPRLLSSPVVASPKVAPSRRRTLGSGDAVGEAKTLDALADELCQNLRVYRHKLGGNLEMSRKEGISQLERELQLTTRALVERKGTTSRRLK